MVWPVVHYKERSLPTRRGRLSLACSGRQRSARWPSVSSSLPFSSFSGFSRGSSCPQPVSAPPVPFRPHTTRRVRSGRDNPRKPEAGAVSSIPRGGMDNRVLTAASGTGKEAAATVITIDRPWPKPFLLQELLETLLLPRTAGNSTRVTRESSPLESQLVVFTTGLGGNLVLWDRLQGRCWSRGQLHRVSGARRGSGGALVSRGGAPPLRLGDIRLLPLFPSISF